MDRYDAFLQTNIIYPGGRLANQKVTKVSSYEKERIRTTQGARHCRRAAALAEQTVANPEMAKKLLLSTYGSGP